MYADQDNQNNNEDGVKTEGFEEEKQRLDACVTQIDSIIAYNERLLGMGKAITPLRGEAAMAARAVKEQDNKNLKEARPNPYFGRVDYVENETPDKTDVFYLGKFHIPVDFVYSWTNPVGNLFFNPIEGTYKTKEGRIFQGQVVLKREFTIENAQLHQVFQAIPLPSGVEQIPEMVMPLTTALSGSKGIEAQDIVATIQPKQYEQIVAALQQVMIIQGVPGSGKSEVGLHRVAYLLSPFNALNLNIEPERVVVFGPSRAFLRYVSRLLPSLNINRVMQTTVSDWLIRLMSSNPRLERRDKLLDKQLKAKKGLGEELDAHKIKVSLLMARILERHVSSLRKGFIDNIQDLYYNNKQEISKARIKRIIRESKQNPLNVQRNDVLMRIRQYLREKRVLRPGEELPKTIEEQFNAFWPAFDYRDMYIGLLSDTAMLISASQGRISEHQATIIAQSMPKKSRTFQQQDLPALCYSDYLLNGREYGRDRKPVVPLFEHVVIDEAQDISPLEFYITYLYSRNKSFTILGDMGQHLLEHRGISDWSELQKIFKKESVLRRKAPISYRATKELTNYANRVRKTTAPKLHKATPYKRHGERPTFIRSKTYADMVSAILDDIRTLKEKDVRTIAVLCKTTGEATKLYKRLVKAGLADVVLLDKQQSRPASTVVASIFQTKGIEYDAVILSNARTNNYTNILISNRLLYVAVTRAAHILHIHWFGALADALVDPSLLPKTKNKGGKKRFRRDKKG